MSNGLIGNHECNVNIKSSVTRIPRPEIILIFLKPTCQTEHFRAVENKRNSYLRTSGDQILEMHKTELVSIKNVVLHDQHIT